MRVHSSSAVTSRRAFRALRVALAGLCLSAAGLFLSPAGSAQAPEAGDFYEDKTDLGFKVKMPAPAWDFTPPQPNEGNLLGKYTPPLAKYINVGPNEILWLEGYLIKFDRRKKADDEAVKVDDEGNVEVDLKKLKMGSEDLDAWLEREIHYGSGFRVVEKKDLTINKVPATEYLYKATVSSGIEFNLYAVLYHLQPDVDVAVVFDGPADDKKWRKYESVFKKMANSFRPVEVEAVAFSGARADDSAHRSKRRGELEDHVSRLTGWSLYETPNYFFLSNVDDPEFLTELMDRLEAIRERYEELYPWEAAERIRAQAAEAGVDAEKKPEGEEGGTGEGAPEPPTLRTTAANASSRELSRCSVVRVCASQNEYHEYGGPGGSAGYWNSHAEELVLYDDKAGGGRRDTWAVLNHEAFHQYIFYLYGSIAPHSWYNEGHGDFFSGHQYKHKKFVLKPFDWRQRTIQEAVRTQKHVPLKEIVRWTQAEYYGGNKLGADPGQNYAQGWSFVYFLRTGKAKAKLWNDDWNKILDVYFEALAATGDLDKAVDTAFAGVDWDELERAWIDYTLRG